MRTVSIHCSTAGVATYAWVVDKDCQLIGFHGSVSGLLTTKAGATSGEFTSPSTTFIDRAPIAYITGSAQPVIGLKIPLLAGEGVYFASTNVGSVILYLEDI